MDASDCFKKILVIRTDRIGDVIFTTPALAALRRACPASRITVLVRPLTRDLIQGNPDIDDVLVDDREGAHQGIRGFWRLVSEIRRRRFDAVVNFHTKKRTNLLCALAGIPRRFGYKNNKWGFLLTDPVADMRPQGIKHEAQYCLDLLRELGVKGGDWKISVQINDAAEQWAEMFLGQCRQDHPGAQCVALHVGASCPTKCWPISCFSDLVGMMTERYPVFFVIIGTGEHAEKAAELRQSAGSGIFYDLTGRCSLMQTVSLLKRCDLLISNDSGPVHLAAAVGTPVVSIFTRNLPGINPERWAPLGPYSRYVGPEAGEGLVLEDGRPVDLQKLYHVKPQQVFGAVDALFQL